MKVKSITPIQGPIYHVEMDTGEKFSGVQLAVFTNHMRSFELTPMDELSKRTKVRFVRWALVNFTTGEVILTMDSAQADREWFESVIENAPEEETPLPQSDRAEIHRMMQFFGADAILRAIAQLAAVRLDIPDQEPAV